MQKLFKGALYSKYGFKSIWSMEYGRRLRGTILADRLRSTLSDDDGAIFHRNGTEGGTSTFGPSFPPRA
jgi:hypothetical protein